MLGCVKFNRRVGKGKSLNSIPQNKVSARWSGNEFIKIFGNMRRALYEREVYFWRIFFILNSCAIFKFCGKLTKFIYTKYTIHCCLYLNFFCHEACQNPNKIQALLAVKTWLQYMMSPM